MAGPRKIKPIERADIKDLVELAGRRLSSRVTSRLLKEDSILEIRKCWPQLVSQALSTHSLPVEARQQQLLVQVDHSIFGQQVQMLSSQVLNKLNNQLGLDLKRIKVRVGKIYWSNTPQKQSKVSDIMSSPVTMTPEETEQQKIIGQLIDELQKL